ncbi:SDR family oxidoreductase [Paucibacter sp. R3-3]|uniref:SDR family oxidoreductase n=1 Tax=Roseateles agri TaxID=3098619 RepID=A0ABU5DHH7_9BURK|nr:SDR family oxidoreductase [Paucibacter sp. R3-3]MDY0745727.1 SDR family oxidoreductase [Paucibacter sp. R3-3]
MSTGITNKVIVITGASSGLGEAAARLLAEKGAKLALGARRIDRLHALAQELGGDVVVQATDVTDAAQVQALADAALARFGRIDVMVNNAGLMPHSPLERLKIADWDQMIDVNIKGVLYGIAAVLPTMQAQKSGHIVNVASVAGLKVRGGATVYAATKHAVRALSEGLRLEVKPHNIRTTVISPGALDTELIDHITEPDVLEGVKKTYSNAISSDVFARALVYALEQPPEVDVNEVVFRPTVQEF